MTYNLQPKFDKALSFYGKARVELDGDTKALISYETKVAEIKDGNVSLTADDWAYTQTTLRHLKEFLLQEGFEAGTKKQIMKRYSHQ